MSRVSQTLHPQLVPVPVPDAVAILAGSQIPESVLRAEKTAMEQAFNIGICRGPRYMEAREYALADLARANKTLAAYNPGLIVRAGGGSR